jgi:hypothetical protein
MFYFFLIRLGLLRKCVLKSCVLTVTHFWQLRFLAITSEEIENWMMLAVVKFLELVSHREVQIDGHQNSQYCCDSSQGLR